MAFQQQVNVEPALGVAGDFASMNPIANVLAGEGALVAGDGGLVVGVFGWVQADGRSVLNKPPSGSTAAPDGFVHRDLTGQITNFYDESSMVVPEGYMVSLYAAGDFFASASTAATRGQKIFASTTDGSISTGAAGATVAGYVETKFYAASTCAAGELVKISTWDHA
ncbi:hypothetical protein HK16_05790 [Acetobacter senegalensis]|uniref:Uncharacterized protein n=3 Tax=Acetobacteraceae TaxID=433 RepID=A0A252ELC5_9PROT|nr:hypothetical protein CIW82_13445 [Acetobacter tropicalis]OUL67063.1 hypothetical protein HK16_05790 [Acetobacter senegalensis]